MVTSNDRIASSWFLNGNQQVYTKMSLRPAVYRTVDVRVVIPLAVVMLLLLLLFDFTWQNSGRGMMDLHPHFLFTEHSHIGFNQQLNIN